MNGLPESFSDLSMIMASPMPGKVGPIAQSSSGAGAIVCRSFVREASARRSDRGLFRGTQGDANAFANMSNFGQRSARESAMCERLYQASEALKRGRAVNYEDPSYDAKARPRGRRWFVVQSQPRKEMYAGANLERQGFKAYVPRLRQTKRHARKTWTGLVPLFPRYLFVSLDLAHDRWRSVSVTYGVTCIVSAGSWPLPAPTALVEDLIAVSRRFGVIDLSPTLRPGEQVRFLTGPFADVVGRLVELDAAGRARVLLELLGAQREITVTSTQLAAAGESAEVR